MVRLHVHAAISSSSTLLSLSELLMRSCMLVCTLGDGFTVTGTIGDGDMSTCVCGGGGVFVTGPLGDGHAFTCAYVPVKIWGC